MNVKINFLFRLIRYFNNILDWVENIQVWRLDHALFLLGRRLERRKISEIIQKEVVCSDHPMFTVVEEDI
jgi:hypothetical protein